MPFVQPEYLLFAAAFTAAARLAPPVLWPWLRDAISVGFLLWWDPRALALFAGTALVAWLGARFLSRGAGVLWGGIGIVFGAFVAVRIAQRHAGMGALMAPAGFGFLALRVVHWWVERAADALPKHSFRDFLAWILYFPTVLVGPVQRFDEWKRWERRRRWDEADAALGLRRVLYGYVKVVVLASWLVGAQAPRLLGWMPPSVAGVILGTASLYWVFSGLSDLAIGLGRIAGQRVPENFDRPFLQPDLPSFWRGWHTSVSEWVRTYVYYPMLARTRAPQLSAVVAMGVFATWHELSLAYVVWGGWHAVGLGLWYRIAPGGPKTRVGRLFSWIMTVAWVMFSFWILRVWPRGAEWYAR